MMQRQLGQRRYAPLGPNASARAVLLPLGSCEQHAQHLPFATDHIVAESFTDAVLELWGEKYDLIGVPGMPYGISLEHAWCPGTLTLPPRVYADVVTALCVSIAGSLRPRAIIMVNGHGGNVGALESIIRDISQQTGMLVCVVNPLALSRVDLPTSEPDIHAAFGETSVLLHLAPMLVGPVPPPVEASLADDIRALVTDRGVLWPWHTLDPAIAHDGAVGDPAGANPEFGRRIWMDALQRMGQVLARIDAVTSGPRATAGGPVLTEAVVRRFLRCPVDRGELDPSPDGQRVTELRCRFCAATYQVVDGIPVLVVAASETEPTTRV